MPKYGPIGNNKKYDAQYLFHSKFLEHNISLIVFDFDDTLIHIDSYSKHSMEPEYIKKLTDDELERDFPHYKYFRYFIINCTDNGIRVAIASFGVYSIIRAYMDRIFGFNQKYFLAINIYARNNASEHPLVNKNEYIYNIMDYYRIKSPERVLFFDDLMSNISSASVVGINAFHVETLFGPHTMENFDEKIMNNKLINNAPDGVSHFGNVGDRKVSIDMYGRKDRKPHITRTYFTPDGKLVKNIYSNDFHNNFNSQNIIKKYNSKNKMHNNELDDDVYISYKEPQFRENFEVNNKKKETNNNSNTYNYLLYLVIFCFVLILILAFYMIKNDLYKLELQKYIL